MFNLIKYRFLRLVRSKTLLFWNLIFPLALASLFGATLTNMEAVESFETISIAVIDNDNFQKDINFQTTLNAISDSDDPLFHITYTDKDTAIQLLEEETIEGIIEKQAEFHVMVAENGMNQTIIQSFMDEYIQKASMISTMIEQGVTYHQVLEQFEHTNQYIQTTNEGSIDPIGAYFYTILAMCCLYGGYFSIKSVLEVQANQSAVAARNSLAPVHKFKLLLVNFIVDYIVDFTILMILLAYMICIIQIDFGEYFAYMIAVIAAGVMAGNSLGMLIGISTLKSNDFKTSILTAISMACSFLAGMMMIEVKYFVQRNIPILSMINPANMMTDALYTLYYYGVTERYFMNIISLFIFSIMCYVISYFIIRRKQYASL